MSKNIFKVSGWTVNWTLDPCISSQVLYQWAIHIDNNVSFTCIMPHLLLIQFISTIIILDLFQCHFWTMRAILKIVIKTGFYCFSGKLSKYFCNSSNRAYFWDVHVMLTIQSKFFLASLHTEKDTQSGTLKVHINVRIPNFTNELSKN